MKKGTILLLSLLILPIVLIWFSCNPFQQEKENVGSNMNVLESTDAVRASSTIYASPSGSSSNGGTSFSDALDIRTALSRASAGSTVLCQSGTYYIPYSSGNKNTINLTQSGTSSSKINVEGSGGQATIDFQFPTNAWVQDSYGLYVTGSYWTFKNIDITRAGYQGAYVTGSYNDFDTCRFYSNRNSGIEINKGGNHSILTNCDSYSNFDLKNNGEMADGFAIKQTVGSGNQFYNCDAWANSDDAWDFYDTTQVMYLENCTANDSGRADGNGNGFKLGGLDKQASHTLRNCTANNNLKHGFHANSNPGPIYLINCSASGNGGNDFNGDSAFVYQ